MEKEEKKLEEEKDPKVITGQNIENGLNYKETPVIDEQIDAKGTAILG